MNATKQNYQPNLTKIKQTIPISSYLVNLCVGSKDLSFISNNFFTARKYIFLFYFSHENIKYDDVTLLSQTASEET